MAGFRLTTKIQVSGWRFLLRRVEHAIVRRDTRMFDDPLQFYSRAVSTGIVIAVMVCLGAVALAYFKPLGKRGSDTLVVDRATNQLYVMLPGSDLLRPVYNLTSARLALGHGDEPTVVKSEELNRMPKGQPIGIPGAPYATPAGIPASTWSLCDTVTKPDSAAPEVETSVLIRSLVTDMSVGPVGPSQGMLVSFQGGNWLVNDVGRHAIDLSDRAVTSAVGIPVTARATPISEGLFNALPNMGPWQLPQIPAAGAPNTVGLPDNLVIGSVFQTATESGDQHYVVLADGVARVNDTTAAALRATNSYGLITPPTVESSVVAKIPEQVYVSPLPAKPMNILLRQDDPVLPAVQMDAACAVINLFMLPGEPDLFRQCIANIARVRADCDRYGMPLMIEPLVMAPHAERGGYMVDGDAEKIVTLVRLARELGADIVKADPTADPVDFHRVVEAARCPVLVRGGGKEDLRQVFQRSRVLLDQGAVGMVYGRNVYQHAEPAAVVLGLMAMIHEGASAETAWRLYQEADPRRHAA